MPVASGLIGSGQRRPRLGGQFRLGHGRAGPGTVMPVKQDGQMFGLIGGDAEHDARLAPWLLKRVADVARDGRQWI